MSAKVHTPPEPTPTPGEVPTTAEIKAEVDQRHIGTPVSTGDLGAAPMYTGAEAAGTPATPEERLVAAKGEAAISAVKAKEEVKRGDDRSMLYAWGGGAVALLLIAVAAFAWYLSRY